MKNTIKQAAVCTIMDLERRKREGYLTAKENEQLNRAKNLAEEVREYDIMDDSEQADFLHRYFVLCRVNHEIGL